MRFNSLELLAFGRFSGEILRFGSLPGGIDLVYGDNEAGKSTSLRAVSGFLYGLPVRTTDDFVHQKPTLRIGAEIEASDGEVSRLYRRKGAKDTLRTAGDVPVSEDSIVRMLGGLDRDLFDQMFALSREALAAGAHDLLTGSGSLGEALFGASIGLAGINDILSALEAEAADLFKPGGSVPALNASLRELDDLRRQVRGLELRPTDYLGHASALEAALSQRETLDAEIRQQQAEHQRLERYKQLLPLAALRAQLLGETAALGTVTVLGASAREERLAAKRDLDRAVTDAQLAEQAIAALSAQLKLLEPRDALLARGDQIRALHKDIGAHQKAARDLPSIRAAHRTTLAEARSLLAQTHPDRSLEQTADLRPTVAVRTTIASLSEDFVRFSENKRAAVEKLASTRIDLARARGEVAALPSLPDVSSARAVLAAARRLGDIESDLAAGEAEYQAASAQLRADLGTLRVFDRGIGDLEALPVPSIETVARFEVEHQRLADQRRDLDADLARIETQRVALHERLQVLDLAGVVPSEHDLTAAREHRDRGWTLVRQSLQRRETAASDEFDGDHSLPNAFEISVRAADEVADRLRREADRVAQKAELDAAIATCDGELVELQRRIKANDAASAQCVEQWMASWAPAGFAPLPPVEMRAWLKVRERLVAEAALQRKARGRIDGKSATLREHREALARELAALGCEVGDEMTLAAQIALAEETVEDHARALAVDTNARETVRKFEEEEGTASDGLDRAAAALATWAREWAHEVAKLGLPSALKPEQVRAVVDTLADLFAKLETAATFQGRIEAIDRDTRAFADAAGALAQAIAPHLAQLPPDETVSELHRLLDAAQAEATKAQELAKQVEEKTTALNQSSERRQLAKSELDRLMKAAKSATLEELELAEERSRAALELRTRLQNVEEQMTQIGAAPAATLSAEVDGLDLPDVEARIQQVSQLNDDLNERRRELDEAVGQERALLKEMAGGDAAAERAAAAEGTKASVREQAEQYARLRIAIAVLRGQIDRFREDSHGPLLNRAGHFFSKLTCAECSGLTTGFDERGNVVLLGRRNNGAEMTVDQMSEGTRDQLYLALRLATIEQQLKRSEPLPLIVDDLFVNFDDRRAAAGFEALAEIAENTQVVFFTHHRHLVELAVKTLRPEQWTLQELTNQHAVLQEKAA
jgi:uncharacterized protein YhaN